MDVPVIPNVLMLDAGENLDDKLFVRGDLLDALSIDTYFKDVKCKLLNVFDVVTTKLHNHISDTYCHTNPTEKRYWNNKLDKIIFDEVTNALNDKMSAFDSDILDIKSILNNLPDMSDFVKRNELPDMSIYALKSELPVNPITSANLADALEALGITPGETQYDIDYIINQLNEADSFDYIKNGSVLGTINGQTFRQGDSITISGGSGDGGSSTYVLPVATPTVLGGIKVGYTTNGKNYKVQLDPNNNAFVNVPWYPGEGGSSYDDTEVRGLISDLEDELSEIQTNIVNTVRTTVSDLFDHEEWLRANFPWDEIFTIDGWDDKINAYFREVGLLNSDGTSKISTIEQGLDKITLRVTQLERHSGGEGGSSITGTEIATRLDEAGYPLAEMKTFYEALDADKNIILQLVSGFRSWTQGERESFALQYASKIGKDASTFAAVQTKVTELDTAQASLTAQYNNIVNGTTQIAGVLTTANADTALATIFARNDSDAIAQIITEVSGDDSFINLVADRIDIGGYLTAGNATFNGTVKAKSIYNTYKEIGRETFSSTRQYQKYDYAVYTTTDGGTNVTKLYRFNTDHKGAWNQNDVSEADYVWYQIFPEENVYSTYILKAGQTFGYVTSQTILLPEADTYPGIEFRFLFPVISVEGQSGDYIQTWNLRPVLQSDTATNPNKHLLAFENGHVVYVTSSNNINWSVPRNTPITVKSVFLGSEYAWVITEGYSSN